MEKELLKELFKIKKNKVLQREVKNKLKEFEKNKNLSLDEKFFELCFCIMVANNNLKRTLKIWKFLKKEKIFLKYSKNELSYKLKELGLRFYNKRGEFIIYARRKKRKIEEILKFKDLKKIREHMALEFKGIGFKEASHFLRNIGYKDFAILDRHILKILKKFEILNEIPKNLSKKKYLKIEKTLEKFAKKLNISQAELDIYLFYLDSRTIPEK